MVRQTAVVLNRLAPQEVHPALAKRILADGYPFVYDHKASFGSYLVDAMTGKRYLDLFSFFASAPLTYNHPKMRQPEFVEKLTEIALINPSNSEVYTEEMAEFVDSFARLAVPEFPHLFFIAGGAPAVENALKVAFDWKVRKNMARGLGEKGQKVIHFKEAFHGRLGYTVSLTNTADPRKYMYFPRHDFPRVDNPKLVFPLDLEATIAAENNSIKQIEEAFEQNLHDIAAIIIEPIQGEGGDNHFRPEFFQALRRIADEREAMLIFDEVQTGIGITGKMWAYQHMGVKPDILVFGKKAQVCGIAVTERVDEVEKNVFVEHSRINSTWGGNLVDMVRGQRYLEIIHEDNLIENAAQQGQYFQNRLGILQEQGAPISNMRGLGLMIAFDLKDTSTRDKLIQDAFEAGLLLLPCGTRSIRLRPHLDIARDTIDQAISMLSNLWFAHPDNGSFNKEGFRLPNFETTKSVAIIGAPLWLGQTMQGVAKTPQAMREAGLHKTIEDLGLTVADTGDLLLEDALVGGNSVPDNNKVQKIKHGKVVGEACRQIAELVAQHAAEGNFCLTIGGDHAVAFGSITGILRARPDTALVWVDAHGDFNTPATSPSGNLHGMPLAALLGYARNEIEGFEWMDSHISRDRVALIGLRSVDEGERKLLRQAGITVFTMTDVDRYGVGTVMQKALAAINPHLDRPIHLSYDVDAIDPTEAPGTGTRVRGGLSYREAHYIAESLAETGRLGSMDIVEINPELDDAEKRTVTLGVELVASALGKSIL